jgi:endonuclease YncB( thermonuclease family)
MLYLTALLIFGQIWDGKVVGVTDGDTITLLVGTEQKKIRLAEIDAPEKSQAFGNLSKMMLSEKVFGKEVRVTITNKDKYNRYVGKITCNGRNINEEMVKEGYAWNYKQYSHNPEMAFAEFEARKNQSGLWQLPATPPWDFRKQPKSSSKSKKK